MIDRKAAPQMAIRIQNKDLVVKASIPPNMMIA